jgi:hypothetical protein
MLDLRSLVDCIRVVRRTACVATLGSAGVELAQQVKAETKTAS